MALNFIRANRSFQTYSTTANKTNHTASYATAPTAGNLLILHVTIEKSAGTITAPAGWTVLQNAVGVSNSQLVAWKIATASEPAPVISWTTASGGVDAAIYEISGQHASTPVGFTATYTYNDAHNTNNMVIDPPAATLAGSAFACLSVDSGDSTTGTGFQPTASGWVLRHSSQDLSSVDAPAIAMLERPVSASEDIGSTTFTFTAVDQHQGVVFLVNAADTTPPPAPAPVLNSRTVDFPDPDGTLIGVNVSNATSARLKVGTNSAITTGVVYGLPVTPNAQGDAILSISGLPTSATEQRYYYRVAMTNADGVETLDTLSSVGEFVLSPTGRAPVTINFGSCLNAADSAAGTAIADRKDQLFFVLGDPYYDDDTGTTVANYRTHIDGFLRAPNIGRALATAGGGWVVFSDHDLMVNDGTAASTPTGATNLNAVVREKIPGSGRPATTGIYRTKTWGTGVRFIFLDTRSFANPGTTVLGATQKQWLKDTITAATEDLILIVQDVPWIITAVAGEDGWEGTPAERDEIGDFIAASGKNVAMLAGDMHAVAADDGTNTRGGFPIYQAAPLNNTASIKGGPYSSGVYPASGANRVEQYGRLVITPGTNQITAAFTGYSATNTARITQTDVFSTASPVNLSDSLANVVADAYTNRTNASGDETYDVPTATQAATLSDAFGKLMSGNFAGAAADVDPLGYDVVLLSDTVTGRSHALLRERTPATRYWGLYVWSRDAARTSMVVEAPHPKSDLHTHTEAAALFDKANAKALLVSTAHRNSNAATEGDGDRVSDLANYGGVNPFQEVHEVAATAGSTVVQVHGYADSSEPNYDIIMSEGQSSASQRTQDLAASLRTSTGLRIGAYDGTVGAALGATGNTQGAQSRAAGVYWLHVEQNSTTRSNTTTRGLVEDGLATLVSIPAALDKLRLGATVVGLRVGSLAVAKACLGTTQVWP